jgi:hypothetical protein
MIGSYHPHILTRRAGNDIVGDIGTGIEGMEEMFQFLRM